MFDTAYEPTETMGHDSAPDIHHEGRPLRIAPDSWHEGKDVILTKCREVICRTGMQASDVRKGGYASWRRELHTRLLREEDHYFGLMAALILAQACKVKVEIKVS